MLRTLKIFLLILGLGIFILPKQVTSAQSSTGFSMEHSNSKECCKTDESSSCNPEKSPASSDENNCGDDCSQCQSCTVHFVINFVSPTADHSQTTNFPTQFTGFEYRNSFSSYTFQKIWQPPKLG